MVHYTENIPWNFGITPSEYFEMQQDHLKCTPGGLHEINRKIALQNYSQNHRNGDDKLILALNYHGGVKTLDKLFQLTTLIPPLQISSSSDLHDINNLLDIPQEDKDAIALIQANAKPAGMIEIQDPSTLPKEFKYLRFDAYLSNPSMQRHCNNYYVAKEPTVIDALQYHQEKYQQLNKHHKFGIDSYLDLVHGILFGYPIADVLELNTYYDPHCASTNNLNPIPKEKELPLLLHKMKPELWAKPWKDQIGMEAEIHLHAIYERALDQSK